MDVSGVADRTAVVTGGAGGIGRAVGERLALAGASVALWDLSGDVKDVAAEVTSQVKSIRGATAPAVTGLTVDITDAAAIEDAFTATESALGAPTILVHAAGLLRTGTAMGADEDDLLDSLAVNAGGTMLVTRSAARRFVIAGGGVITVIGSNAAAVPRLDMAGYGAAKAAATSFVKSLGLELAPHGVRCNVISPGSTDTPMLRGMWNGEDHSESVIGGDGARFRLGIPLGRIADPRDIAETALFLSSDAARHITMHDLRVDGGATLDA